MSILGGALATSFSAADGVAPDVGEAVESPALDSSRHPASNANSGIIAAEKTVSLARRRSMNSSPSLG